MKSNQRSKRSDFFPSLASINSETPSVEKEDSAARWDSETIHQLSYFLGGDPGVPHGKRAEFADGSRRASEAAGEKASYPTFEDANLPPPTPSNHFYYSNSSNKKMGSTKDTKKPASPHQNSSSGSLASLTAATKSLISGGPFVMEQLGTTTSPMSGYSPISPAAMISGDSANENLLLPHQSSTEDLQRKEQHMAWLRDVNEQVRAHHVQAVPPVYSHDVALAMHAASLAEQNGSSLMQEESEEKRAKRLQRNRESARKSRRRKKERLENLEKQVKGLQDIIDVERNQRCRDLGPGLLLRSRTKKLTECLASSPENVLPTLRNTGPMSAASMATAEYQYSTIKQLLCPRYHHFFCWHTLRDQPFFFTGKEEYVAQVRETDPKPNKTPQRTTSKQVGEALFKKRKDLGPGLPENLSGEYASQTSYALDRRRMWPLTCYEIGFSLDQEEKFMAVRKRAMDMSSLPGSRFETVTALDASMSMRDALSTLSSRLSRREEQNLGRILYPEQLAAFQGWKSRNEGRARRMVDDRSAGAATETVRDASLLEVSRKLQGLLLSPDQ